MTIWLWAYLLVPSNMQKIAKFLFLRGLSIWFIVQNRPLSDHRHAAGQLLVKYKMLRMLSVLHVLGVVLI